MENKVMLSWFVVNQVSQSEEFQAFLTNFELLLNNVFINVKTRLKA